MTHSRLLPTGLTLAAAVLFVASAAFAAPEIDSTAKTLPGVERQIACALPTPVGPLGY